MVRTMVVTTLETMMVNIDGNNGGNIGGNTGKTMLEIELLCKELSLEYSINIYQVSKNLFLNISGSEICQNTDVFPFKPAVSLEV